MAGYNEITKTRWQNVVRRVFGLQGAGGNVPLITPEIQPVVMVQPDRPEFALLRDEHRFGMGDTEVGAAAVSPFLGLTNPAGSNRLVVVSRVAFASADISPAFSSVDVTIAQQALTETLSGYTVLLSGNTRDLRRRESAAAFMWRARHAGGVGNRIAFYRFAAVNANNAWSREAEVRNIVIPPGDGLALGTTTSGANLTLYASFEWYERVMQDESELRV